MDKVLRRFPDVAQDIFKQLDDKSLVNCMEVNKIWHNFLDNDSLFWRRRIQKYNKNQTEFKEPWKLVTTQVPTGILKELALATEIFYKKSDAFHIQLAAMKQERSSFYDMKRGCFECS